MLAVVLVFLMAVTGKLKATEIDCEMIEPIARFEKCCYLNEAAEISEANVTFAGVVNPDVEAIQLRGNKNIEFLPVDVYKKFPNLEVYMAKSASVKQISALNFAKLPKLRLLNLQGNQIEFIPDDCFQGLTRLYKIDLRNESLQFNLNKKYLHIYSRRFKQYHDSEWSCFRQPAATGCG